MARFLFVLLLISQTGSAPTTSPTSIQLSCPLSDGYTTNCSSFCGETVEQQIYIGVENQKCPIYPDTYLDTADITDFEDMSFATTVGEVENGDCIKEEIGCAIPWLCQILNDESDQTESASICSTADVLFNIWQLDCEIQSPKIQYTQFKLQQLCCNTNDCSISANQKCSHSAIYQAYSNVLYKCLYSKNAIENKYENVRKCNDSFDTNNYNDVCDFLISETYSKFGCECKSSYLIGHTLQNEKYNSMIVEWNNNNLKSQIEQLSKYGCARNIECVANDKNDNIFVGGLLNIIQVLYTIECQVFVPYHNINESAIEHIENQIQHESGKIYVTFPDSHYNNDPTSNGKILDIFVVYFSVQERDMKYKEWTTTPDWFGDGSEIKKVESKDINQTLSYYGADKYYKRTPRNTHESFIAAIVLAVIVGLLLFLIFIYNCRN